MKLRSKKIILSLCLIVSTISVGLMGVQPAFAEDSCTNVLDSSWCDKSSGNGIKEMIKLGVQIMTAGITVAAIAGIIWCGVLMTTARDDAGQVAKARKRMIEIVIGLVAWFLSAAVITLVLPGGDPTGELPGAIVTKVGDK